MAKRWNRSRQKKDWSKDHKRTTEAQKRDFDQKRKKRRKDWWGEK